MDEQVGREAQTNRTLSRDGGQAAGRRCSPTVPRRPGRRRLLTLPGEKEPSPLAAVGLNPRFLAALVWSHLLHCFLAARLCGVCVPSALTLPTPRKDQEHRKPLRPKRVEASRARARTGFERTLNLATIQGRILGRKEHVPYPGMSEGKELVGNKRSGPPGKRAFPLERAAAQGSGGQGGRGRQPRHSTPTASQKGGGNAQVRPEDGGEDGSGCKTWPCPVRSPRQPPLAVPQEEPALLEGSPVQRHWHIHAGRCYPINGVRGGARPGTATQTYPGSSAACQTRRAVQRRRADTRQRQQQGKALNYISGGLRCQAERAANRGTVPSWTKSLAAYPRSQRGGQRRLAPSLVSWPTGLSAPPRAAADGTNRGGAADTPDGCAALQRDPNGLEKRPPGGEGPSPEPSGE